MNSRRRVALAGAAPKLPPPPLSEKPPKLIVPLSPFLVLSSVTLKNSSVCVPAAVTLPSV